jgi:hypothetical protein
MNNISISLGWNCYSAIYAVNNDIRKRKNEGYNTCPFDEMVTNYHGIVKCLEDDFQSFYDEKYLYLKELKMNQSNEYQIYNLKYNFYYNHESPGHAKLYITQGWPDGINHYINNNYFHFKERYSRRVNNFRNYLKDPNNYITFVITSWNKKQDDMGELKNAIEKHYPNLKYEICIINDPNGKEYYLRHMKVMYSISDYEVQRLL